MNPSLRQMNIPGTDTVPSRMTVPSEIVFVGSECAYSEEWVRSIVCSTTNPQIQVVYLDSESDGIETISRVFSEFSGFRSVHIVSSRDSSSLRLGNVLLCDANIASYAAQIAAWPMAFASDAVINLHGCSLPVGDGLVDDLSILTAAEVRSF